MKGFFGCLVFVFCAVFITIAIFDIISISDAFDSLKEAKNILSKSNNPTQKATLEESVKVLTKTAWLLIVNLAFKFGLFVASMFVFTKQLKKID